MSKGQGTVSTKLEKGIHHSDTSVRLLADIDNTAAKTDCKAIQMTLVQDVMLNGGDSQYSQKVELGSTKVSGLLKGEKSGGMNKFCDFDFGEMKLKVSKADLKGLTENERNYAMKVQPTITG